MLCSGGGFVLLITTTAIISAMLTATVMPTITMLAILVAWLLDFTSYKSDEVTVKGETSTFVKGELVPALERYQTKRIFDVDGWTLLAWLM